MAVSVWEHAMEPGPATRPQGGPTATLWPLYGDKLSTITCPDCGLRSHMPRSRSPCKPPHSAWLAILKVFCPHGHQASWGVPTPPVTEHLLPACNSRPAPAWLNQQTSLPVNGPTTFSPEVWSLLSLSFLGYALSALGYHIKFPYILYLVPIIVN